jgi:hypothetical protein
MSGIKNFDLGDEILRPDYKKPFSEILSVASILDFLVHKKYTLILLCDENFFSLIWTTGV